MIDIAYPNRGRGILGIGKEDHVTFLQRAYANKNWEVLHVVEYDSWNGAGNDNTFYIVIKTK